MRKLLVLVLVTAGLGALPISARSSSAAQGDPAKGAKVYAAQKCSQCHQIAGKGNKNSPLDGVGTKLSAADLRSWIVDPIAMAKKANSTKKPPMANKYSKLPAADIDSLVAYMQTLK